ncbi:hypothetical protein L861_16365 [Litchfieldella anticariensis FP35 = DSM 16096]|uniref:Uncharacterized protein n=1 Tax=Litchfieldella anticariensis (strain DSM 16096 / CECT 5854 / CIP 108499 / LMG 22089 / FP35) TaxID=1121939 RepID=S2KJH5_LITA3|nr:hypothetical protein L861_16365 [Halomonas anticariensis FP35 = DSM 16096]
MLTLTFNRVSNVSLHTRLKHMFQAEVITTESVDSEGTSHFGILGDKGEN